MPNLAREKTWYSVAAPGVDGSPGASTSQRLAVSDVVYQARTHTIRVIMPRKPSMRGNVLLTIETRGIVNLVGQQLEGNDGAASENFVREVDLP